MTKIDVERWISAEDETHWHRQEVQGFLYRDEDAQENDTRAGLHVVRDLTLDPGKQIIWQLPADHAGYNEAHHAMLQAIRRYRTNLIAAEYEMPAPKVSSGKIGGEP
jgi:hypothetical protein